MNKRRIQPPPLLCVGKNILGTFSFEYKKLEELTVMNL